jgi:predicted SnoaL-like aldol condensation-catalyzing enzyme
MIERARGRLNGGRQGGRPGEVNRRRDRRVIGQHRQFGLGRAVGGEAEHAITNRHVRNALTEFVDDTRCLVAHCLRELPIHQALALLPVARDDAGGAHRYADLARTRMPNPDAQDGPEAFIGFVKWLRGEYPNLKLRIKRVIAEGDLVATHAHLDLEPGNPDNPGRALADFFLLEDGKVVEHWDVIQEVPKTSANKNGMFSATRSHARSTA